MTFTKFYWTGWTLPDAFPLPPPATPIAPPTSTSFKLLLRLSLPPP